MVQTVSYTWSVTRKSLAPLSAIVVTCGPSCRPFLHLVFDRVNSLYLTPTEVDITEKYTFTLEATFQTNVPYPVVTIGQFSSLSCWHYSRPVFAIGSSLSCCQCWLVQLVHPRGFPGFLCSPCSLSHCVDISHLVTICPDLLFATPFDSYPVDHCNDFPAQMQSNCFFYLTAPRSDQR